jgi:CheY-like chemotaxis protein
MWRDTQLCDRIRRANNHLMARILICHGNSDHTRRIAEKQKELGHEVVIAATGQECLEILKGQKFDEFFLDSYLPNPPGGSILDAYLDDVKHRGTILRLLNAHGELLRLEEYF